MLMDGLGLGHRVTIRWGVVGKIPNYMALYKHDKLLANGQNVQNVGMATSRPQIV